MFVHTKQVDFNINVNFSLLDTFSLTHALTINISLPFDKCLSIVDRKVALLILAVNDFLSLAMAPVTESVTIVKSVHQDSEKVKRVTIHPQDWPALYSEVRQVQRGGWRPSGNFRQLFTVFFFFLSIRQFFH